MTHSNILENSELRELTSQMARAASILVAPRPAQIDTIADIAKGEEFALNGSYEQIVEIVEDLSSIAKLDVLNLWEQIAFAWVAGCGEMGSSSFGFHSPHKGLYSLAMPYDLVATAALGADSEMKLSVNGKRKNITRADFGVSMKRSGLREKIVKGIFSRFIEAQDTWSEMVDSSTLDEEQKIQYKSFLKGQIGML